MNYVLFKGCSYGVLHLNKIIMKSFYKKNCKKYNVDNMYKPLNKWEFFKSKVLIENGNFW